MADEEYYEPNIISVNDDEGNEILFELLEKQEIDGTTYVAITRYYETDEEIVNADYEVLILKVIEENNNEYLIEIDDEEEYNTVSDILMKMVEEEFDVEYIDPADIEQ